MRVLTLDNKAFAGACAALGAKVAASGFIPDIIVGIRTGGAYVAENIVERFDAPGTVVEYVDLHRGGTPLKKIVSPLFRLLPEPWLNFMRKAESRLSRSRRDCGLYEVELPESLKDIASRRILVVDDAVDRGKTLASVLKAIAACSPQCEVRSAAITVTQPSPLVMPDYFVYNDLTLVRFPWAPDMKGKA